MFGGIWQTTSYLVACKIAEAFAIRDGTMDRTDIGQRTITLRPADQADVSAVVAMVRELAEYEKLGVELGLTEAGLERYVFGDRPAAEVVLAEVDGALAGFALFSTSFSTLIGTPVMYLDDLYVRPAYRGMGLGRSLLSHLARLTLERGYGRLDWYVLNWNEPAIAFYKNLGARHMTDWSMFQIKGEALARLAERG